jgi:hypothetical protein
MARFAKTIMNQLHPATGKTSPNGTNESSQRVHELEKLPDKGPTTYVGFEVRG